MPVSIVYRLYKQILESNSGGEENRVPLMRFAATTSAIGSMTVTLNGFGTFTAEYNDGKLTVKSLDSVDTPNALVVGDVIERIGDYEVGEDICLACGELLRYRYNSRGSLLKLGIKRGGSTVNVNVSGYYGYVD